MNTLQIRPLSINEGYTGRRFKTPEHKNWECSVMWMLPNNFILPQPPLQIYLKFGFSSKSSDWDNCVKHFQDALCKKYRFDDKVIRRAVIETEMVKKGQEFIRWELTSL